jgi:hypothetical protein
MAATTSRDFIPARIAKDENEDPYFDEVAVPAAEILACVSAKTKEI